MIVKLRLKCGKAFMIIYCLIINNKIKSASTANLQHSTGLSGRTIKPDLRKPSTSLNNSGSRSMKYSLLSGGGKLRSAEKKDSGYRKRVAREVVNFIPPTLRVMGPEGLQELDI